ncbi:MAG TPA: cytochrome c [Pyrinomonadaceae bacterium]|nr:cytochrome c [Pyrinomonadaceae bacterium]
MKSMFWSSILLAMTLTVGFALAPAAERTSAAADPRSDYTRKCANCHGRDGRSKTARGRRTHSRDLTDSSWQDDVSDERLFNSINNGRGKMPGFKKSFSENEIEALVGYVRRLRR